MRLQIILIGIVLFTITESRTVIPSTGYRMFDLKHHRINNVDMPITNYGEFGMSEAHSAGTIWPIGSGEPYIFGAGIWIGAIVGDDTLVSCGYNTVGRGCDFVPGPPDSTHIWDHYINTQSHPEDRLYFSTNPKDLEEWPKERRDKEGNPILLGHEDAWCEYNDLCDSLHLWEPNTYPLGLHIRQLSWAWSTPIYANMVFILYEFTNVPDSVVIKDGDTICYGDTLENMYVGHASDMDVGAADNDLVGCDIERSLGYTYTLEQEAGWESKPPYYVGVRFLQGPRADDTVYVADGPDNPDYPKAIKDTVYPGEHLPLTAFVRCTRAYDATNEFRRYSMLAGYNIETGDYDPWMGVVDAVPADKRMVMGCGPFKLLPGETDTFLIAVMFSNGDVGGLRYLQEQGDAAKTAYDFGWVVAGPPEPPNLTAIPGDKKVTLIWDNISEVTPDKYYQVMRAAGDTVYRKYDFEGYRLWRSRSGLPDDWELLGEWDIKNDITLLPGDMWSAATGNVSGKKSNNNGLVHSYVDSTVYNGITYYYALTSFDYNTRGVEPNESTYWVSMETGKRPIKCTPRSEASNFKPPKVLPVKQTSGNTNSITIDTVSIKGGTAVTGHTYELFWCAAKKGISSLPIYTVNVRNVETDDTLFKGPMDVPTTEETFITQTTVDSTLDSMVVKLDSTWAWVGNFAIPFDGISVNGNIRVNLKTRKTTLVLKPDTLGVLSDTSVAEDTTLLHFVLPDEIKVERGTYQGDLRVKKFYPTDSNKWAHHGGKDLEIHWERYHGSSDSLTMKVVDALTGAEIPYADEFGDNWCFVRAAPPKPQEYIAKGETHAWFYICGVMYLFNNGMPLEWSKRPQPGDIWKISCSSSDAIPPGIGDVFTIETEKGTYETESKLDQIKVVPNPYIVRAMWDKSREHRHIEFTHLPSECTIRIYTLAGDLVRIIKHSATAEEGGTAIWDLLTRNNQWAASGIYIYHISTPDGKSKVGKFAIIR